MYTDNKICDVTVSEHKTLIDMLSSHEYIYRFDARYRTAVLYDNKERLYSVCACSSTGKWFVIDHFQDKNQVDPAFEACKHAVLSCRSFKSLDHDLYIVGIEITR